MLTSVLPELCEFAIKRCYLATLRQILGCVEMAAAGEKVR